MQKTSRSASKKVTARGDSRLETIARPPSDTHQVQEILGDPQPGRDVAMVVKKKKPRHRMTDLQLEQLEALFRESSHPSKEAKQKLADEAHMTLKTVTIWFQNRRQTTRRRSARAAAHDPVPALGDSTANENENEENRPPLAAIFQDLTNMAHQDTHLHDYQRLLSSIEPACNADAFNSLPGPGFSAMAPLSRPAVPPHDLWKYLQSSPSSPARACSPGTPSPPSKMQWKDGDVFGSFGRNAVGSPEKHKWSLDWACTRMEERRRVKDAFHSDISEKQLEEDRIGSPLPGYRSVGHTAMEQVQAVQVLQGSCARNLAGNVQMNIPTQFFDVYPPDIVLGASLLLDFKYSSEPA
ncbi:uncharacterized protein LAESUDRAFT_762771 [Laetiporus sulphureus 93-53]|uniref:Homeobox domain-containing protein n=1 Tax=Laetiporus sulphureus 93-53 TaxID=1314785 RepID=A0A165C9B8_9APHY|nr:uncharacterized protein LAESUDRAFT_762771 [Laetiporus sulphureus 93-53]KZT02425.1 hypothetical protein LAESUDRAFT_762771 [Laetiporus sulphureus 93-53]